MGKILIADIFNQFMKNFETGGYCHTACWLKKKVRPTGNMVL